MDHSRPEDSHTQTHPQNKQSYLQSGITKPQRWQVTSKQIGKLQRSTWKSTMEKTVKKKRHHEKWIRTVPCIMLHHHETWLKQKHLKTSMLNKQQGLSHIRTQSSQCIVMQTLNYSNQSKKVTFSANT